MEWTQWSDCSNNHLEEVKCWKDVEGRPQKTRTRPCFYDGTLNLKTCNQERVDCTDLPSCPIGKYA